MPTHDEKGGAPLSPPALRQERPTTTTTAMVQEAKKILAGPRERERKRNKKIPQIGNSSGLGKNRLSPLLSGEIDKKVARALFLFELKSQGKKKKKKVKGQSCLV